MFNFTNFYDVNEDAEVAAATEVQQKNEATTAVQQNNDADRLCLQSLPAYIGGRDTTVSSSTSVMLIASAMKGGGREGRDGVAHAGGPLNPRAIGRNAKRHTLTQVRQKVLIKEFGRQID